MNKLDKISRFEDAILLVRFDNIGDFVLWLDTAKEYRKYYPEQKIVLAVKSHVVEFAESFNYWDEVLGVDDLPKLYGKDFCFNTIINCVFSRTIEIDECIHRLNAKHKIASIGDYSNISIENKEKADKWYTTLVPASTEKMMELERNAEFLSNLFPQDTHIPSVHDITHICQKDTINGNYIIIFPGASWIGKRWEVEKFAHLIDKIKRAYPVEVFLCGAGNEYQNCLEIASLCKTKVYNLAGQTTLNELTTLIHHAIFLIGNDTSAVHIASAVNTPNICILGGGHFGRFLPYSENIKGQKPIIVYHKKACFDCNWRCQKYSSQVKPVPCIEEIVVDDVWSIFKEALPTEALSNNPISKDILSQFEKKLEKNILVKNSLKKIASFLFAVSRNHNSVRVRILGVRVFKIVREGR